MSLWIGSRMSMKSLSGCAVGMEYREKRMLTQVSLIKAAMCLSQVRIVLEFVKPKRFNVRKMLQIAN